MFEFSYIFQLSDFTELRAPNAEKAAFYFDAAVSSRTMPIPVVNEHGEVIEDPDERRNSNMIFTLHVYQYMIDKVGTGESKNFFMIRFSVHVYEASLSLLRCNLDVPASYAKILIFQLETYQDIKYTISVNSFPFNL